MIYYGRKMHKIAHFFILLIFIVFCAWIWTLGIDRTEHVNEYRERIYSYIN